MDQPPLNLDFEAARKEAGLSLNDLSSRTNIPKTSLIRFLADPAQARVGQWFALARELNLIDDEVA